MIITTLDMVASLLAGMTVFSILGNVLYERGSDDIRSVVRRGPGLAFVAYSEAIAKFYNVPQVLDILCIRVR